MKKSGSHENRPLSKQNNNSGLRLQYFNSASLLSPANSTLGSSGSIIPINQETSNNNTNSNTHGEHYFNNNQQEGFRPSSNRKGSFDNKSSSSLNNPVNKLKDMNDFMRHMTSMIKEQRRQKEFQLMASFSDKKLPTTLSVPAAAAVGAESLSELRARRKKRNTIKTSQGTTDLQMNSRPRHSVRTTASAAGTDSDDSDTENSLNVKPRRRISRHRARSKSPAIKPNKTSTRSYSKPERRPQTFTNLTSEAMNLANTAEKIAVGLTTAPLVQSSSTVPSTIGPRPTVLKMKPTSFTSKKDPTGKVDTDAISLDNKTLKESSKLDNGSSANAIHQQDHADKIAKMDCLLNAINNIQEIIPKSSTDKLQEVDESNNSSSGTLSNNCIKCEQLSKRVKTATQAMRNLQRQNGCLESIISQKRNLVEQLTKQVRGLIKENFNLAKHVGIFGSNAIIHIPNSLAALQSAGLITDNSGSGLGSSKAKNHLIPPSTAPPKMSKYVKSAKLKFQKKAISSSTLPVRTSNDDNSKPASILQSPRGSSNDQNVNEQCQEQPIDLESKCQQLEHNCNNMKVENQNKQRFINDLLYTLNARGYESLVDFDGIEIDLFKRRGDHLLDLKGRDARQRVVNKRPSPHESLLKAVIGSQENMIQNLVTQLDTKTKDNICSRLSTNNNCLGKSNEYNDGTLSNSNYNNGDNTARLENEILALFNLIESVCLQNPQLIDALHTQKLYEDSFGSQTEYRNVVLDAVLERCNNAIFARCGHPLKPPSENTSHNSVAIAKALLKPLRGENDKPIYIKGSSSSKQQQRPSSRNNRRASTPIHSSYNNNMWPPSSTMDNHNSQPTRLNGIIYGKRHVRCVQCGVKFPLITSSEQLESHLATHGRI